MARPANLLGLPRPLATLLLLISASARHSSALQTVDSSQCECFITNGSVPSYYDNHAFFDFRSLSQYQSVPDWIQDEGDSASASVTSDYFSNSEWTQFWQIENWNNSDTVGKTDQGATILMINSPNNVYIQPNTDQSSTSVATWLTLRTMRLPGFQSAAELDSITSGMQFLSMRMYARTIGQPGAVTAMFTYLQKGNTSDVEEADLEVLTKDPSDEIQYTNQPSVTPEGSIIQQATENATMPGGTQWTDWVYHRMDWTPGLSTWYVNGQQVANNSFQAPKDASQVILNSWSDGSTWSGNMSVNDAAYLQVQWFEIVYNLTGSAAGKGGCNVACSIDEGNVTGSPVLLFDNAAPGGVPANARLLGWAMPVFVMLCMCLFG